MIISETGRKKRVKKIIKDYCNKKELAGFEVLDELDIQAILNEINEAGLYITDEEQRRIGFMD
jgi:hypothetical protein